MKKILIFCCLSILIGCKSNTEEIKIDETKIDTVVDSIGQKDTIAVLEIKASTEMEATEKIVVKTEKDESIGIQYASFGDKILAEKALTKEQMLEKYASLKKGDTIAVKFKSKITSVCKKKGCWMKMDLADKKESFVRFTDYGFFVPLNADNSDAIVSGKAFLDVISIDELKHYAKDCGKSQDEIDKIIAPKITYAFQADGVLIQQ